MNTSHSSGNLTVDKRADYARMLAESGDFQAAADLMVQALELAPVWAAGWYELAKHLERAGRTAEAVSAYRTVLGLSPGDRYGARLKLARLAGDPLPPEPQSAYVEALFDAYAANFDTALTGQLRYRVPELISTMLSQLPARTQFDHAIDLGCGTGLMALALGGKASKLSGIDLSAGMLAKAEARGLYHELIKADLVDGLSRLASADMILAADVLVYFGSLDSVFEAVSENLRADGIFAFSVEKLEGDEPFALQKSLRHAHSERYIVSLAEKCGLALLESQTAVLRRDGSQEITGLLFMFRKLGDG
jgi:predicted TPR repeat methyltransferase